MIYNNRFILKNKINLLLLTLQNILEIKKPTLKGRFLFCIVQLD